VRRALADTDLARPGDATPPDDRPPSAAVTAEIVCSITYGPAYAPLIDVRREGTIMFPDRYVPRAGATAYVLHIGDSMVYGANVPRDQTFTAHLNRLEPDVEHVNGGVSGTAPDDYFALLRAWTARQRFDLAAMYVFAGNDLGGLDAPRPCADWQSLLVYDGSRAHLRFTTPRRTEGTIGLPWLLVNSPPPYVLRALIVEHSAAAAFVGHALSAMSFGLHTPGPDVQFQHLEAILRSVHEDLRAKGIPLVVVALPSAAALGNPRAEEFSRGLRAISGRLDIPEIDATPPIRDALARGDQPAQADGSHFSEAGHVLIARWLHEHLGRMVEDSRR
jgi:lysophospholipase L1-like esterase